MHGESFMKALVRIAFVLVLLPATARTAAATPIILTGGFETGDFTNWTATPGGISSFGVGSFLPYSGSQAAFFGGMNIGSGNEDTISQSFATTAGQSYIVGFWAEQDQSGCGGNCFNKDFHAYWNGGELLSLTGSPVFSYTEYSFMAVATGATSTLSFAGADEPGWYRLDDVSVNADSSGLVAPVPEPASLTLVGAGLAWLGRRRLRRRRNASAA